ncbi:MAG: hypothetical protein R3C58_05800 [Parvularculaceae bacterium]
MRIVLAILASFVSLPALASETLPVRAGEHGDYSRLVIPNPPEGWRIATSDRKVEIQFPDQSANFELSEILDKRKAHRVLSARVVDGDKARSIVLSLTCDCPVRTSRSAENSIVIDIFNEAPVTLSAEEEGKPETELSDAAKSSGPSTPENMRAARDRMIALLAEARHQGVVQLKIDDAKDAEPAPAPAKDEHAPEPAHPVTEASHTPAPEPEHKPEPHAAPLATHEPEHLTENHIEPAAAAPQDLAVASTGGECIDPSLFYEPDPGEPKLDYSAISRLRQRFDISVDADERRDLAATLALAYMEIGFFEEAGAIASPRGREGDANMAVADALADIGAGARSRAARTLTPFKNCGPFFEMAYAAAAASDDPSAAAMQEKHIEELRKMLSVLRGPFAENLGLNALERGDKTIAKEFYAIAKKARGRERTPALAILESELADDLAEAAPSHDVKPAAADAHAAPSHAAVVTEELKEVAQTPGPYQAKALAILATDYEKRANEAYEGLLDDIAAQSGKKAETLSEARASFTGARTLANAGRLREGLAILDSSARNAPGAKVASQALARSLIMSALNGDAKSRIAAVSAFFYYHDFVFRPDNGDLNIAVARELAAYGAVDLVDEALKGSPPAWRGQAEAAKALALLNSGDPHAALDVAAHGEANGELAVVAVRAHERLDDRAGAVAAIKTAMRRGANDNGLASAAWRAGEWSLANDAFAAVPKKERSEGAAARVALAGLNGGAKEMPQVARDALENDPETRDAIAHMYAIAPAVSVRAIDLLAGFTQGVVKETNFMSKGLSAEGAGDE